MLATNNSAVDFTFIISNLNKSIQLEPPFKYEIEDIKKTQSLEEVNLGDSDPFTQCTIKELVTEQYKHQLGYIIAIAQDTLNNVSIYDGCHLVRHYRVYGLKTSPFTRAAFKKIAFYRLPPPKKTSAHNSQADKSPSSWLKFNFVCQKEDLVSEEWFLNFISAHDLHVEGNGVAAVRVGNQLKVGLIYEDPEAIAQNEKIVGKVRNKINDFFRTNTSEAFYWYQRAAEGGNPDAYMRLSHFYDQGLACTQSEVEAFKCTQKAFELLPSNIHLIRLLAYRYLKGLGTPVNIEQAQKLVDKYNKLQTLESSKLNQN